MSFLARVYERARAIRPRVVFPEGDDPRVQEAAKRLERDGLAVVEVLQKVSDARLPFLARHLRSRRPDRFPTDAAAAEALEHPLTRGACLVGISAADVMVGGAVYPSADTVRAALWAVGTAPGIATISGAFYMVKDDRVLTFADCAVVPDPTSVQLADIAIASARDRRRIVGDTPLVTFLSYSTRGSAEGPRVERVQAAITQLRGRQPAPDFVFDGELQADAALVPSVAESKAKGSSVAGKANVLIFPDLQAGNIAYKLLQELGGAEAVGPILLGLNKPVHIVQLGSSVREIVNMVTIAVLDVQGKEEEASTTKRRSILTRIAKK
jgi:phosphate acetyltransferase